MRLAAFPIILALAGCSLDGIRLSGTSHETETGNQIAGILHGQDGKPASGLQVHLRASAYCRPETSLAGTAAAADAGWADSAVTDRSGAFRFRLRPEDTGSLVLEALDGTAAGLRVPIAQALPKPRNLGVRRLEPTGTLQGEVAWPAGEEAGSILLQVLGSPRYLMLDPSTRTYAFPHLPPGNYTLRAAGFRPQRQTVEFQVEVPAGGSVTAPVLPLGGLSLLIVDGANNHDWQSLTRSFRGILEETLRFRVDVATAPPPGSDSGTWSRWNPPFGKYDAVLLNYSDIAAPESAWPERLREALRAYVDGGGGLVITQSAQSAFTDWEPFREMSGLAWGGAGRYPGLELDSALQPRAVPVGQGASRVVRGSFLIRAADPAHPILRGMPAAWLHAEDAVDLGLRGPAANLDVLSYLVHPGSGAREPVAWTVAYGRGRVFNTALGDVVAGGGDAAVRCAGFRTLLARGAEWAASGKVTLPIPFDFPSDSTGSLRPVPPAP